MHEAVEEKVNVVKKGNADKNCPVEPSVLPVLFLAVGTEFGIEFGGEYEETEGDAGGEGRGERGGEEVKNGDRGWEGDGGEGRGGVGEGAGGG